jgi:hypothetical protein
MEGGKLKLVWIILHIEVVSSIGRFTDGAMRDSSSVTMRAPKAAIGEVLFPGRAAAAASVILLAPEVVVLFCPALSVMFPP